MPALWPAGSILASPLCFQYTHLPYLIVTRVAPTGQGIIGARGGYKAVAPSGAMEKRMEDGEKNDYPELGNG